MIPINYHHLYYLWTVARVGSITAAAQSLCLSQSALSLQLAELERACNAKLLERGRRGVALTFEGRLVFERCERIFAEGEELAAMIRGGFKAPLTLRLGVQPSVSREVVLQLLDFIHTVDPSCRVTVLSRFETLADKLRRHTVDLVLANQDLSSEVGKDFVGRLAGRLPVAFVTNSKLRRKLRRFPADLEGAPMLLRSSDNPVRKQVDRYLGRRQVAYRLEADSDDVDLLRRLAMEGRGVAVLSRISVANDLKTGRLQSLHHSPIGVFEDIWLVCPLRPRSNAPLKKVLDAAMSRFSTNERGH